MKTYYNFWNTFFVIHQGRQDTIIFHIQYDKFCVNGEKCPKLFLWSLTLKQSNTLNFERKKAVADILTKVDMNSHPKIDESLVDRFSRAELYYLRHWNLYITEPVLPLRRAEPFLVGRPVSLKVNRAVESSMENLLRLF